MKKKSLNVKKIIHRNLIKKLKNPKIKIIYNEFENSLKKIDPSEKFAVALSGGADSLALTYLAKCYSILNKVEVKFYHIDHKLRKESFKEAKQLNFLPIIVIKIYLSS